MSEKGTDALPISRKRRRDNKGKGKTIMIAPLNVGSMTGRGQEVVDVMERRKINIMCVQEAKWKGSKARELGNGLKLFYIGEDERGNGVGIILNDEMKKGVLSVKRRSDRIIWVKVALNGEIINIMSAYAPQTGCGENEKIKFWEEVDEDMRDIPDTEKLWVGGDFNDHCGRNNSGKEETIGKYGVGESNEAGDNFVAFAMCHNNESGETYFEKTERHNITYKSGAAESQIDYILCRSSDNANIKDCKVILDESVTNQHRPLVCTLISNKATERKTIRSTQDKMVEISRTGPQGSVYRRGEKNNTAESWGRNAGVGDSD